MQTRREWLKEADEMVPGPELTAMRVARYLQVESRRGRCGSGARLMREENLRAGSGRCTAQCRGRIAVLRRIEMVRADVVDASKHQHRAIVL